MECFETLAQTIAANILNGFKSAPLKDGERLNERIYMEKYGVSQTVVREAFYILETKDLVQRVPRRGVFIKIPGVDKLEKMFETRELIETFVNAQFARLHTEEELSRVESIMLNAENSLQKRDIDTYYVYGRQFHGVIFEMMGFDHLKKCYENIQDVFDIYYMGHLAAADPYVENQQDVRDHRALLEAFAQKDTTLAETITRFHLHHIKQRIIKS